MDHRALQRIFELGVGPRWSRLDLGILGAFVLFTLPITLPVLQSFFTFDDLENLSYYTKRPGQALWSNLVVFTSFRRPAGALFYLPSYWLFGLNPLPLYATGFSLFYLNLGLFYWLVLRLTGRRLTAALALVVCAFHPHIYNVLFNFGAVYELLACASLLLGILTYGYYRSSGDRRLFWLTLGIYLVGLNAKETAVGLPALLLLYELLYVRTLAWKRTALTIAPLFAVAILYTLVKTLGAEAFWRTNPLYILHFDMTFYSNLAEYFSEFLYKNLTLSPVVLGLVLVTLLGISLGLRDRHLLFGLGYFFLTLLPILLLPRVWALFLYIPLGGAGIFLGRLASLLVLGIVRLARATIPLPTGRTAHLLTALGLLVLLRTALVWAAPEIRYARDVHFFSRTQKWREFSSQLYRQHESLATTSVLGFRNPPFNFETADRWSLHFLVWLHYDPTQAIRIYQLPQQQEAFQKAAVRAAAVHEFEWRQGKLTEMEVPRTE